MDRPGGPSAARRPPVPGRVWRDAEGGAAGECERGGVGAIGGRIGAERVRGAVD